MFSAEQEPFLYFSFAFHALLLSASLQTPLPHFLVLFSILTRQMGKLNVQDLLKKLCPPETETINLYGERDEIIVTFRE